MEKQDIKLKKYIKLLRAKAVNLNTCVAQNINILHEKNGCKDDHTGCHLTDQTIYYFCCICFNI